ncbi:MAG: AmmeMemoRadiSam system protein B [bacterium]
MKKAAAVRKPAVAGMFYPENRTELHGMVTSFLNKVDLTCPVPKALVVPHAGYVYSGPIAATGYAQIRAARSVIRKVILLGPSHRVPFHGLAVCGARYFETPLGDVPVDAALVDAVLDLPQVRVLDSAHAMEHSLEVHLPFLQETLEQFSVLPLVVGDATPEEISEVLEKVWGGKETLIVVSSDLSHYYDYETAKQLDEATSRAIEALKPEDIQPHQACGRVPLSGLLVVAARHGLKAKTLDLRNSGDTVGPRDQVVGYGAYVFT